MGSVSMNYLTNLLGPNAPLAATFIVAFAAVLVLIGLTAWIFRLLRGRGLGIGSGGRGRQPRLAVLDYADVDQRRKLVLIRRDNVEHLLLLGGPTDVVVETSIVRGMPVQASALAREPAPAAAPAYVEPDPPMPQQRPSLREAARQAAGESAPARPVNLDMPLAPARSEPLRQEPARPAPQPAPRPEPPRAAPVSAPAAQRPEPPRIEPVRPETPRITPVVTPPARPASPGPTPAAAAARPASAAQDDVAARLEAALRKPIGATPAAQPARPLTPPASPSARPVTPAAAPQSAKALSADEKSVFDSLEEEMAALLGRGPTPPKS